MSEAWYRAAGAREALTQGDLIFECPALGPFGLAETLSKAENTAMNGLVEAGIVRARSGKVKLVGRAELPEGWDPAIDKRLTVWETSQHMIRTLETKGEAEAAALLNRLGGLGETARELP